MDREEGRVPVGGLTEMALPTYSLERSALYRLPSKAKLCELLGMTAKDLRLVQKMDNFKTWPGRQKAAERLAHIPHKPRAIQEPKALMRAIHARLASLLRRLELPEFLHSARKGRSYLSNALAHREGEAAVRVDIKSFYPAVTQRMVKKFFEKQLCMPDDVAHTLARLCCYSGRLPTGSPLSPILSYFACSPIFRQIGNLADQLDLTFTLYVDDIVLSGVAASRQVAARIQRDLAAAGLVGHKLAYFPPGAPKVVTGVAMVDGHPQVPHRRQQRMRKYAEAFSNTKDPADAAVLARAMMGQFREAERIQRGSRLRAQPIVERLAALQARAVEEGRGGPTDSGRKRRRRRRSNSTLHEVTLQVAALRDRTAIGAPPSA